MQPCVRGCDWHVVFYRLTQPLSRCCKAMERLNLNFCVVFSQLNYDKTLTKRLMADDYAACI